MFKDFQEIFERFTSKFLEDIEDMCLCVRMKAIDLPTAISTLELTLPTAISTLELTLPTAISTLELFFHIFLVILEVSPCNI